MRKDLFDFIKILREEKKFENVEYGCSHYLGLDYEKELESKKPNKSAIEIYAIMSKFKNKKKKISVSKF